MTPQPSNFYAVRQGKHSLLNCIFLDWTHCEKFVDDFEESDFATFHDITSAIDYLLPERNVSAATSLRTLATAATGPMHQAKPKEDGPTDPVVEKDGSGSKGNRPAPPSLKRAPKTAQRGRSRKENRSNVPIENSCSEEVSPEKKSSKNSASPRRSSRKNSAKEPTERQRRLSNRVRNNLEEGTSKAEVEKASKKQTKVPKGKTPAQNISDEKPTSRKRKREDKQTELKNAPKKSKAAEVGLDFDESLQQLKDYKAKQGSFQEIPPEHQLWKFIKFHKEQCRKFRSHPEATELSPSQFEQLKDIGMLENENEITFEEGFKQLQAYKEKTDSLLNVEKDVPMIAKWAKSQRIQFTKFKRDPQKSKLSASQARQLKAIGLVDTKAPPPAFDASFQQLKAWKAEHGTIHNIPVGHPLRKVVTTLRTRCKKFRSDPEGSGLTQSQFEQLKGIAIIESEGAMGFDEGVKQLQAYKEKHGDVMKIDKDHPISKWAKSQRTQLLFFHQDPQKSKLTASQVDQLKNLGLRPPKKHLEFDEGLEQLRTYKGECGGLPPLLWDNPLSQWARRQKLECEKARGGDGSSALSPLQMEQLRNLNLMEAKEELSFEEICTQLQAIKEKVGTINNLGKCHPLTAWIKSQKKQCGRYGKAPETSILSQHQAQLLVDLGVAQLIALPFGDGLARLRAYKQQHGNIDDIPSGNPLASWVQHQESRYTRFLKEPDLSMLSASDAEALKELGVTTKDQREYSARLRELKAHKEEYGHTNISATTDPKLYYWIDKQKRQYQKWKQSAETTMTAERIEELVQVGLDFANGHFVWETAIEWLQKFKNEHGHANITETHEKHDIMKWLRKQKIQRNKLLAEEKSSLTVEKCKILEDNLGVEWDKIQFRHASARLPRERSPLLEFDAGLELYVSHLKEHGEAIPQFMDSGLRWWCGRQKSDFNKLKQGSATEMTAERMVQLTDAGFVFPKPKTSHSQTWEDRINELRKYRDENGHCRIRLAHPSLGSWIKHLRLQYELYLDGKECELTEDKVTQLDGLGMIWEKHYTHVEKKDGFYINEAGGFFKSGACYGKEKRTAVKLTYERLKKKYGKVSARMLAKETKVSKTFSSNAIREIEAGVYSCVPAGELPRPPKPESIARKNELRDIYTRLKEECGTFSGVKFAEEAGISKTSAFRYKRAFETELLTPEEAAEEAAKLAYIASTKPKMKTFDDRYEELCEFKKRHGHTIVPVHTPGGLGKWVNRMRVGYKRFKGDLPVKPDKPALQLEKIERLNAIGFVVDATNHRGKTVSYPKEEP